MEKLLLHLYFYFLFLSLPCKAVTCNPDIAASHLREFFTKLDRPVKIYANLEMDVRGDMENIPNKTQKSKQELRDSNPFQNNQIAIKRIVVK